MLLQCDFGLFVSFFFDGHTIVLGLQQVYEQILGQTFVREKLPPLGEIKY
jgi:hypothetical protein